MHNHELKGKKSNMIKIKKFTLLKPIVKIQTTDQKMVFAKQNLYTSGLDTNVFRIYK